MGNLEFDLAFPSFPTSILASPEEDEDEVSRLGGRLLGVLDPKWLGGVKVEEGGMLRAGRAVEDRASGVGLVRLEELGSSCRSQIPAVD